MGCVLIAFWLFPSPGVFSSHYKLTIGVDFALKAISWDESTKINLQLWWVQLGKSKVHTPTRTCNLYLGILKLHSTLSPLFLSTFFFLICVNLWDSPVCAVQGLVQGGLMRRGSCFDSSFWQLYFSCLVTSQGWFFTDDFVHTSTNFLLFLGKAFPVVTCSQIWKTVDSLAFIHSFWWLACPLVTLF